MHKGQSFQTLLCWSHRPAPHRVGIVIGRVTVPSDPGGATPWQSEGARVGVSSTYALRWIAVMPGIQITSLDYRSQRGIVVDGLLTELLGLELRKAEHISK
jgi:hypothetical protein